VLISRLNFLLVYGIPLKNPIISLGDFFDYVSGYMGSEDRDFVSPLYGNDSAQLLVKAEGGRFFGEISEISNTEEIAQKRSSNLLATLFEVL